MKATAKILDAGKITIPATVREELGLEKGDVVEVDVERAGAGRAGVEE